MVVVVVRTTQIACDVGRPRWKPRREVAGGDGHGGAAGLGEAEKASRSEATGADDGWPRPDSLIQRCAMRSCGLANANANC